MKKTLLISKPTLIYPDNFIWNFHKYILICFSRIQQWRQNAKTRKQLENLPLYLLRDIGLTEQQCRCELQKKFWE